MIDDLRVYVKESERMCLMVSYYLEFPANYYNVLFIKEEKKHTGLLQRGNSKDVGDIIDVNHQYTFSACEFNRVKKI